MHRFLDSYIGDYHLTDFLGAGGMGEVYLAVHRKIDRVVAIKVLTGFDSRSQHSQRFVNEARIQAGLLHPNIATLYDFIEVDGRPCIIMEYVDGQTLYEYITACGALSPTEAVHIFHAVAQAIAYIHQKGILHRDIKSNNIKINSSGQVKLLDFGIAKDTITPKLTLDGHYVGSLYYLSPEQLMGKKVDKQSDIWSLGILLYEMVTGRLPFESRSLNELYEKIKNADHISMSRVYPGIPRNIQEIIARCLKQNPAHRFSCAEDLIKALENTSHEMPTKRSGESHKGRVTFRFPVFSHLTGTGLIMATGLILIIVIFAGLLLLNRGMDNDTPVSSTPAQTYQSGSSIPETVDNHLTKVKVDTYDGRADVYLKNQYIGQTPYVHYYPAGSKVEIRLKREGYQEKVVQFEVGEIDSQYSYSLNKKAH